MQKKRERERKAKSKLDQKQKHMHLNRVKNLIKMGLVSKILEVVEGEEDLSF